MFFNRRIWSIYNTLILSLVSQATLAGAMGNVNVASLPHKPLVTLSIGADFVNLGQDQTLSLYSPFLTHFTSTNDWQTALDVGGFLGVEFTLGNRLLAQIGLSGYFDSNLNPQGN